MAEFLRPVFEHLGELLIGAGLAVIGWVMSTFTTRHIESMDKLSERLGRLSEDVAAMKADINALARGQERTEGRVERLEQREMDGS